MIINESNKLNESLIYDLVREVGNSGLEVEDENGSYFYTDGSHLVQDLKKNKLLMNDNEVKSVKPDGKTKFVVKTLKGKEFVVTMLGKR